MNEHPTSTGKVRVGCSGAGRTTPDRIAREPGQLRRAILVIEG
jgi:hypothetical protein